MIKKLLPHFFLDLVKFPVSFQIKVRVKKSITIGDNPLKLLSLFFNNNPNLCARKVVFFSALFFSFSLSNAATKTSTATGGTWATGTTWVGGAAPVAGDDVVIATTGVNTVTLGANASIVNVTINSGANLNIASLTLTTTGAFINNGAFTASSGRLVLNAGNFINNSGASFTFTAGGSLYLYANYTNSGTVTLGTALVRFYGSANQSIQGFTTLGTIAMMKTGGTATFTGNVNGAALTIYGTGGTLSLGSGLTHTFTGTITRTAGTLDCGSSYLKVGGSFSGTAATFTTGTGTVEYYKAGTQTGAPVVYNNLILSGTSAKTFATTPTVNGVLTLAGTNTSIIVSTGVVTYGTNATLKYSKTAIYTATAEEWITLFAATGGVVIDNTGTITLNTAKVFNASVPLTINSGATLATANWSLTFGGNYINNGGTLTAGSSTIDITNTMATQSIAGFTTTGLVTMSKTAGIATFGGAVNGGALTINGSGGTLNLGTSLTHAFSGLVTLTAGTLNGGSSTTINVNLVAAPAWTNTAGVFVPNTGTVNFGGAGNQSITGTLTTTFNNLTISGSGIKTLTKVPIVNGTLSMEGTGTAVVSVAPTYGLAAKLQYNRTLAQVAGAEWITPFVATGGISVINTGLVTCTTSAKVFGASVPLSVANSSGGGLDNGGYAISGGGTLTVANGATLYLSGTSAFPSGFATNTLVVSSTVNYSGTAQPVAIQNYGNLSLSGSGTKTFAGATTISGELALSGTAIGILLNGTTSSSQTLSFSSALQAATSWGGTGSFATNKNATWFGSTTTGIINVAIACTSGTWLGVFGTDWNTSGNWCGGIIPTATSDIIISAAPNQPNIGVAGGVCRNISVAVGATLTIAASSTLAVSGNWLNNGILTSSGTANFNGAVAQSIGGTGTNVFNNLTNSNVTFPITATAGITINGVLNNSNAASVLDMATFALAGGASFSNTGSGQIKTLNLSVTPIPSGKTWANTVLYNSLTGGQTIVAGNYNASLSLSNTSGTQTASGNIIIGNHLNIVSGGTPVFTVNGFNLTVGILDITAPNSVLDMIGGSLTYAALASTRGTIRFSGATNGKAFSDGMVDYYGIGQTVAGGTYYNLLFTGAGGSYSVTSDLDVNNTLTISNGALTVQNGVSISVDNAVAVAAPGTFTLENNASLVQTSYTGANTGNIVVKRNTTPIINDDFTYWSSPTTGSQTLYNFSPLTQGDKFFDYNNDWANVDETTTVFAPGIGYAIRSPEGTNPTVSTVDTSFKFTGIPNNGTITIPLTVRTSDDVGERLVGNPYPSALDADAFIAANILDGTNPGTINQTISGTLYFWTHNHTLSGNDYVATDYATYNLSSSSGVDTGTGNIIDPTQYIASGQGFFIETDAAGDLTFNNTMRDIVDNTNFYKTKTKKEVEERHRIWLKLTNNTVNSSQATVAYVSNATNDYDNGYDSFVYNETQPYALYSLIGTDKMVIQGKALPFVNTDVVPMGYALMLLDRQL